MEGGGGGGLIFGEEGIKIWWGEFFKVGGMSEFFAKPWTPRSMYFLILDDFVGFNL